MTLRLTEFELQQLLARRDGKKPRVRPTADGSKWEEMFAMQLLAAGITFQRQVKFLDDRRFKFDFAFMPQRIALEIDGSVHRIKKHFNASQEKGNLATLGEWRVLHVSPLQVRNGEALSLLKTLLEGLRFHAAQA